MPSSTPKFDRKSDHHSSLRPTITETSSSYLPESPKSPRSFKAYETTTLESPFFHIVLEPFLSWSPLKSLLAIIYRIRWLLSHPMSTKLVPRWMSIVPSQIRNITVGQLLLGVPLVIFFLKGYHHTFHSPNVSENGKMATFAIYWAFLTANKSNSVFSFMLGIPYERMVPLHQVSALIAVVLGCFHTYVAYVYGGDDDGDSEHAEFGEDPAFGKFLFDGDTNRSGSLVLGALIALLALSWFGFVRRFLFNLWYVSHIAFGVTVLVALFFHNVTSGVFVTLWWAMDFVVRYCIMVGCRNRPTAKLSLIGKGSRRESFEPAVELSFVKPAGFDYNPGQFVRVAIPKLSIFEFHPVSISSAPHEDTVTLHIRELGDWTNRLVQLATKTRTTQVWLEGPYGALSVDMEDEERYKMALFVSGGIGVTPCQSIGKNLLHQHTTQGRYLKELKFVWAVRNLQMVADIPPLGGNADYSTTGPWKQQHGDEEVPAMEKSALADVQVDIYYTQSKHNNISGDLPYNMYAGRPDLDAIFEEMKKSALEKGETSVAVFGCGPHALMADLQEACRKHSASVVGCSAGVFFDLHREYFDL